jgi:hypothetical protein
MRGRLSGRHAQARAYALNTRACVRACVRACQGNGRALSARLKGKQARS